MDKTVPVLSIVFIIVDMIAGTAVPAALIVYFRKRFKCSLKPFLVGCLIMLGFALIMEQGVHSIVFATKTGQAMQKNIWIYGIYGGLMAGLFEETGRLFAFRFLLKRERINDHNALMYGAGHGGFEMFTILTLSMINNLVYSIMINNGSMSSITSTLSGTQLTQMNTALTQLATAAPSMFLVSLLERLAAIASQLALSVLVWFAVKKGGKVMLLYVLAIILHAVLDSCAVIINHYVSNVMLTELAVCIISAIIVLTAAAVWKKNKAEVPA